MTIVKVLSKILWIQNRSKTCNIMNLYSTGTNNAYFRLLEGSDQFQVSFRWKLELFNIEREFNFNRRLTENLDTFFERIKASIEKTVDKKKKRKLKKTSDSPELEGSGSGSGSWDGVKVRVTADGEEVPATTECKSCFFNGAGTKQIRLHILDQYYDVVVNSPWVEALSLPASVMAGFPVYPNKMCISFGDERKSRLEWFRESPPDGWTRVASGYLYTPSKDDIGRKLKLKCLPGDGERQGPPVEVESKSPVEAGPGYCPFQVRHAFTKERLKNQSFRVVSYNILADLYAETEAAKTELFPYCPPYAMLLDYRKHLYLREILGYNADVLCLQEVDSKVFDYELKHVLKNQGLDGVLAKKKDVSEGVATFFSTEKFRLVKEDRVVLSDEIQKNPWYSNFWESMKNNEELKKNFMSRATVVQVLILECLGQPKQKLVVGNTHLYFSPDADHIRLLQGGMMVAFLEHAVKIISDIYPEDKISLLICGDFNSTPEFGIYKLMTEKHIPKNYTDWQCKEGEFVQGLELSHNFNLDSACGTPEFTNYTSGFVGCLDYIFYQKDRLQVQQVVPFPSEDEVKEHVALPSVVFPSDHLALIADFTSTN